jgi:hypothetical protein
MPKFSSHQPECSRSGIFQPKWSVTSKIYRPGKLLGPFLVSSRGSKSAGAGAPAPIGSCVRLENGLDGLKGIEMHARDALGLLRASKAMPIERVAGK